MATICDRVCASRNQPKPHNRQHYNDAVQGSHLATINFNEGVCMKQFTEKEIIELKAKWGLND